MFGCYVALVQASAVRNAQIKTENSGTSWKEVPEAEVYVGIYQQEYDVAMQMAAQKMGTTQENIRLIQLLAR